MLIAPRFPSSSLLATLQYTHRYFYLESAGPRCVSSNSSGRIFISGIASAKYFSTGLQRKRLLQGFNHIRGQAQKGKWFDRSSTTVARDMAARVRVGFVPEHFSTPIAFAQKYFGLNAELIPFPTGTGALANALRESDRSKGIDIAVGLTEGFVADLGKTHSGRTAAGYGLVGTYVESPLCWAISTGAGREEIKSVADLKGSKVGVSRIGSGSYVMSFVLADQQGWLAPSTTGDAPPPFAVVPIGDFAALRQSVRTDKTSDFFMWEHFTTKHFWDNGELKRVGEIYTPWPSWVVAARNGQEAAVTGFLQKVNQGVQYYQEHKDEAVEYITTTMHYSKDDALEWMKTVKFVPDIVGVQPSMVGNTVAILRKAGVLQDGAAGVDEIIALQKS